MKRSLRSWLWRVSVRQEVNDELAFHIEMRTRELIERGMDPTAARETVLSRIGDLGHLTRTCEDLGRKRDREMRLTQWIEDLGDDLAIALRQLKSSPAFTAVAVLTLALGIGANSAMFAVADATFFRPLPFTRPADRLVLLWERRPNNFTTMASPLEFDEWRAHSRSFDAMTSLAIGARTMRGADGTPEQVQSQIVTAAFFEVLGATPLAGRTFIAADAESSASLVVLSEGFWRRRFGADPDIIGRRIEVEGQPATVIGVMPQRFQVALPFTSGGAAAPNATELWILAGRAAGRARLSHYVHVVARLKPSVTIEAAQQEMTVVAAEAARELPEGPRVHGVLLEPLRAALIGPEIRLTSMLFLGVVGFVLLMCCANVANLVLSRTTARARELAVRSALGAGRLRISRQLLTESLLLAALGGLLGLAVGAAIIATAPTMIPPGLLPPSVTLTVDARVTAFCAVATFLVGVLFGLGPAWQWTRASLMQAIGSDSRATGSGGALRHLVVVAEIATAVIVLVGAGLLLRAWVTLDRVDPGYRPPDALTMLITLPMAGASRYGHQDGLRQFYAEALRAVGDAPGVRSAAWGGPLPLDGSWYMQPFTVEGESAVPGRVAAYHTVSPTYFATTGIDLVAGRGFTDADTRDGAPVCIVSEAFVRQFLGSRNPIGLRLAVPMMTFATEPVPMREIVGVARQVRGRPEETAPAAQMYVPIAQNAWYQASLVVRPASGGAAALVPAVREAIARVDPDRPVTRVRTLDEIASEATWRPRFRAVLVTSFAMLALVLAMVGVCGVLAHSVQQRTREFGVRLALGASGPSLLRLVVLSAGRLVAIGTAIGLIAAAVLSRSISTFLFGVQPIDPLTFLLVPLVLMATAAIAVAAPARRASRVDPAVAFRSE